MVLKGAAIGKLGNLVKGNKSTMLNGAVLFVTFSSEEVFNKITFKCPCVSPNSIIYGGSFLFGPAVALCIIGILVNNVTWKLFTGCCYRSKATQHGCRKGIIYFGRVLAQAMLAPVAWIFIGFIDGKYYVCMRSSQPCNESAPDHDVLFGESQIIGWIGLLFALAVALSVMLAQRCMDRFTYNQQMFVQLYRDKESEHFKEAAEQKAEELATANINSFFSKTRRTKLDWDHISVVPLLEISDYEEEVPRRMKRKVGRKVMAIMPGVIKNLAKPPQSEPCFTPLHKWALKERDRKRAEEEAEENIRLLSGEEALGDRLAANENNNINAAATTDSNMVYPIMFAPGMGGDNGPNVGFAMPLKPM